MLVQGALFTFRCCPVGTHLVYTTIDHQLDFTLTPCKVIVYHPISKRSLTEVFPKELIFFTQLRLNLPEQPQETHLVCNPEHLRVAEFSRELPWPAATCRSFCFLHGGGTRPEVNALYWRRKGVTLLDSSRLLGEATVDHSGPPMWATEPGVLGTCQQVHHRVEATSMVTLRCPWPVAQGQCLY